MENIINNLNKLIKISGTNDKIKFVKELNDNGENSTLEVIKFLSDSAIITGISKAKLNKNVKLSNTPLLSILSLIDYLKENNTGKDKDIGVVKAFIENSDSQYKDILFSIFTKSLKLGISVKNLNKAIPNFIKSIEFMRAKNYMDRLELNKFDFNKEYQISLKIDGVRCAFVKENNTITAYSRQGKIINGLSEITANLSSDIFRDGVYDGELVAIGEFENQDDRFQKTCSIVNSKAEHKKDLQFILFDFIEIEDFFKGKSNVKYKDRFKVIDESFIEFSKSNTLSPNRLNTTQYLPYFYKGEVSHGLLMDMVEQCDKTGEEGIMINDLNAIWEGKRTDYILKLKKNLIADVRVLETIAGQGKHEGKLGALKVEFYYKGKNNICNVGSGFTDSEREDFWNNPEKVIGKIIEVKYQKITKAEGEDTYALGFASYNHRIRTDKDETNI